MQQPPHSDLSQTRERIRHGRTSAADIMRSCLEVARSGACDKVFLHTMFEQAQSVAADPSRQHKPLAGLAVSVKDLFDIEGQVTGAGSRTRAGDAPAVRDCSAVSRLRAAGGAIIGRTNMTEFAFSGVGVNPHFGTPANAASRDVALIPGGSSSGAAVSVATGAAFVGLGSDTAGSIRIPAALNGIVGFKNTARLVPTDGAVPLSTTLDTVCAMTRSVADAIVVHEILAARSVTRSHAPLAGYRLAMVRTLMLDDVDATVAGAYQRTLAQLRAAGAQVTEIDLPELRELAGLMAQGGFSGAESYALHRAALATVADQMDPRVVARVQRGAAMGAADYIDLVHARRDWIARMEQRLQAFDAVVSPTVPLVAPPLASVAPGAQRDEEFFRVNGLLLRNTNVVNMFDGCALSLPCHAGDELPVGLMVWHGALRDDTVLNIGLQIEQMLRAG
ncbi:MAG: amidase [Rhodoferax sp.]|nr:amidase [Rhodoferax sp.]MCP5260022.1 amidase [Rhodoferax sp.]